MSDEKRYLEYLQKQIMPDGWEAFFEAKVEVRRAGESTRWKEDPAYGGSNAGLEQMRRQLEAFAPKTKFDSGVTDRIFRPIFNDLIEEANRQPWKRLESVQLLSSTDPSPTPVARPSSAGHILFIGQGTMSYCNYWAKIFSPIVVRLFLEEKSFRVRSNTEIEAAAKGSHDSINLAGALCIYYALMGTTLGFGRVTSLPEDQHYRVELVTAMERFIVAHEISHFIAFQELPGADGVINCEDEKTVERFCDDVGLVLSRAVAAQQQCFLGRSGVAAILFFRTIAWGEEMRAKIGLPIPQHISYPTFEERIELIRSRVTEFDDDKEGLLQMLGFYNAVCSSLISLATKRIDDVVSAL